VISVGPFVGFWLGFFSVFAILQNWEEKQRMRILTNKNGPEKMVSGPEIGCGGWI